jgi:predicted mannosyl-3-phosphoglycerate phosphatase (HAD superfamily)
MYAEEYGILDRRHRCRVKTRVRRWRGPVSPSGPIALLPLHSYSPCMIPTSHARVTNGESHHGTLVIFTRVEGLLRHRTHAISADADDPVRFLVGWGVPIVLVSAWDAHEIRRLQQEFAFDQPFICGDGAALHVPRTWLNHADLASTCVTRETAEWEIFRFRPRSISAAFELVSAMFAARGYDPLLTVGIGCDLADYSLLTAVDIPIVVRDRCRSQPELLKQLPGVYVTSATGTAGWSEALLGDSATPAVR